MMVNFVLRVSNSQKFLMKILLVVADEKSKDSERSDVHLHASKGFR